MIRATLVLAILLAGCQSDAKKLAELEREARISCLVADATDRVAETFYARGDTANDRRYREAEDARAECTLAERDLNRFLND